MRSMRIAVLVLAAFAAPAVPSAAQEHIEYPWCAVYGGSDAGGGGGNCGFSTLEQCRLTISGMGGFCEPNPFYRPSQKPAPRKRQKK